MKLLRADLAERKRQVVRDELSEAALHLIADRGYDETTVDQIAAAAGVSRRTFFRYFQSKDDVIVRVLGELGEAICASFDRRPASEAPATALRRAMDPFVAELDDHAHSSRRLAALILATPALVARYVEHQHSWRAELADRVGRRTGTDPATDVRPALAAAVALAALDVALAQWARGGDTTLTDRLDTAFVAIAPVLEF